MKHSVLLSLEKETIMALQTLKEKVEKNNYYAQRMAITEDSPYSEPITDAIKRYDELCLYNNLKLKEAVVTRNALIKDIDWDLFITLENKTNRDLVISGLSPYAYNDMDGKIELHHIGQDFNAPFVELTVQEHKKNGNNRILHTETKESWRNDVTLEQRFEKEKDRHWKLRLSGEYRTKVVNFKKLHAGEPQTQKELSAEIRDTIEFLFGECTIEDLNYLQDAAGNNALIKEMGIESVNEFINNRGHKTSDLPLICCPDCKSTNYVSYGKYISNGEAAQRYMCKECGKTFSAFNNSIISNSNMGLVDWMKYINCMYNGYTVEETARICNISKYTAQYCKYKLFYALKIIDENVRLSGNIVIDETYRPLSFKGSRSWQSGTEMPRSQHKRGKQDCKRGMSNEQVCIVCALDSNGNSVARVSGCSSPKATEIEKAVLSAIDIENTNCIFADKERAITKFARMNNLTIKQDVMVHKQKKKKLTPSKESYRINWYLERINSYHSRLEKYLDKLKNPASRTLQGYLYLFSWKERNKNRDMREVYHELLSVMLQPCTISSEELTKGLFLPDPYELEHINRLPRFRDEKKALRICKAYSDGNTMGEIARKEKCSIQNIHKVIKKGKRLGYIKKNEDQKYWDKITEALYGVELLARKMEELGLLIDPLKSRNLEIYEIKKTWTGTVEEFDHTMMEKYNIASRQTIKNIITDVKTIEKLKADFYISGKNDYMSLEQKYRNIYDRYLVLKESTPNMTKGMLIDTLSKEFNYSKDSIRKILKIIAEPNEYFSSKKRRLSPSETLNRNRAVFIDLLKWEGTRKDFYEWASEKYAISSGTVKKIVYCCLLANPNRKDQV